MSTIIFNKTGYSKATLAALKGKELVALYNSLAQKAKVSEVNRFATSTAGVERTWKLLEQVGTAEASAPAPKAEKAPKVKTSPVASLGTTASRKKAADAETGERARRGTNLLAPGHAPLPCRVGSKQSVLVDKLSRANGATMEELLDALQYGNKPWTEVTVRSGFGWDLKQKGYGVRSQFSGTGTERFFLVLPVIKGVEAAIPPHTPLKGKPKADARQVKIKAL